MSKRNEILPLILKYKQEGQSTKEIAESLHRGGLKTPSGKRITDTHVYAFLNYEARKARGFKKKKPSTEMISIPVAEEPSGGKVIAIIGRFEDVQKMVSGWM